MYYSLEVGELCIEPGCKRLQRKRRLCSTHYNQRAANNSLPERKRPIGGRRVAKGTGVAPARHRERRKAMHQAILMHQAAKTQPPITMEDLGVPKYFRLSEYEANQYLTGERW